MEKTETCHESYASAEAVVFHPATTFIGIARLVITQGTEELSSLLPAIRLLRRTMVGRLAHGP